MRKKDPGNPTVSVRMDETPVGPLLIFADHEQLLEIRFDDSDADSSGTPEDYSPAGSRLLNQTVLQLRQYFAGTLSVFQLPLQPAVNEFQQSVRNELLRIPWGMTVSYSEIARRIGRPSASRAVGAANGRNPFPIVVPCHRVIGADGSLTGFGGGLDRKRTLLLLEGALPPTLPGMC